MNRTVFTLLTIILCCATAHAQNTMESIRQHYADVKERIKVMQSDEPYPPAYYEVKVVENLPATGPHEENVTMYFDENNDDDIYPTYWLEFATVKYNFAARQFYEEYLYDKDGKIAFIYALHPYADDDKDYEYRFYFSEGKLIKAIIKNRPMDRQTFAEAYTGPQVPAQYDSYYRGLKEHSARFLTLFSAIGGARYR